MALAISLQAGVDAHLTLSQYDKNFENVFCICGRDYDPHTETSVLDCSSHSLLCSYSLFYSDSMYQCVVCEDWLHHACLLGSHSDLNDAPLGPDDFDQMICGTCVSTNRQGIRKILERYAGREGSGVMVIGGKDGAEVLGRASLEDDETVEDEVSAVQDAESEVNGSSEKRKADSEGLEGDAGSTEPAAKRLKAEGDSTADGSTSGASLPAIPSSPPLSSLDHKSEPVSSAADECNAPAPFDPSQPSPLDALEQEGRRMNVYLEEGWMMRWCRCSKVRLRSRSDFYRR